MIAKENNTLVGNITQLELSEMIRRHEEWLANPNQGRALESSFMDFGGLELKGNLSKANFYKCRFDFSNFDNCILDNTTFKECQMNDVHFNDCSSSGGLEMVDNIVIHALFDRGIYVKAKITGCMFMGSSFPQVSVKESEVKESNFSQTSWSKGTFYKSEFFKSNFNESTFEEFYMNETIFSHCEGKQMDFTGVIEMKGTILSESNFSECILENKNLWKNTNPQSMVRESNFTGAKLNGTNFGEQAFFNSIFDGTELNGTTFSMCNLERASFKGAKGNNTSFGSAKLYQAVFNDAVLTNSFWEGAHASRTTLVRADLTGASLQHSDFSNASMQQAKIDHVRFGGCNLSGVAYPTGGTCEPGSIGRCILSPH